MDDNQTLTKTNTGFTWDSGHLFTWLMHYDKNGVYVGQTQADMLGDGDIIFIRPQYVDGLPCVNGKPVEALSSEQMETALA